jgi:hypothetical protein
MELGDVESALPAAPGNGAQSGATSTTDSSPTA